MRNIDFILSIQKSQHIPKLFLKKTEGAKQITFSNTPFSVTEEKVLDCQYGHHYFRKHDSKGKRLCLQGTRKIGCHATIRIKTFILYPEYAIGDVTGKSARQIKLLQESQLELLRKAIAKGDDICKISKYFVSLPSEAAHSGHPTGSSGGYAQRIHPLLSDQISQLVAAGITDTNEVKRSLRFYVTNTLCKELGYHANKATVHCILPLLTYETMCTVPKKH